MLNEKIAQKRKERGSTYRPRTRHLNPDNTAKYTNRLFLESSPYLLQHAHNPVDWYPWGNEAFEEAKKLNRPVLLSIGYSTCHWCHVMEEESFEDEEIARFLNQHYIAVKVDREERPDLDSIYMKAVQALTGHGGWPMTVWLTPDRKPFYGGTYFPARDGDRGPATGFLTLLVKINEAFHQKKGIADESGEQLTRVIKQMLVPVPGSALPDADVLQLAFNFYEQAFDETHGGIKGAPKFPSSLPIRFLLRFHKNTDNPRAILMAEKTLRQMASGGMHDHVAGGFHRYSTDEMWLVPHFEKMLYDNALLALSYLEAYQMTHVQDYRQTVESILSYIEREMTSPEGAFYSATDADSKNDQGHTDEGWFFTWTEEEIDAILGRPDANIFKARYSMDGRPNFEARYILNIRQPLKTTAALLDLPEKDVMESLAKSREKLLNERGRRPPPLRDDKIITAWNSLMISAFARAGFSLSRPEWIATAGRAADFILKNLLIDGRLHRSHKDQSTGHRGFLDDYAFFINALLDLYETDHNPAWLKQAIQLDQVLEIHFEDETRGGFHMTEDDQDDIIAREKPIYDDALPSGNSYAVNNLLRLYELTTAVSYRNRAEKALTFFSAAIKNNPQAFSEMLLAIDTFLASPKEIVIVTPDESKKSAEPFLAELRNNYYPNKNLVVVSEKNSLGEHLKLSPLVKGKIAIEGKATAYVCERGVCGIPVIDPREFIKQLKNE